MKRSHGLNIAKLGLITVVFAFGIMPATSTAWVYIYYAGWLVLIKGVFMMIFGKGRLGSGSGQSAGSVAAIGAAAAAGEAIGSMSSSDTRSPFSGNAFNVDGTPMVLGTDMDVHGKAFGASSDPDFNVDGTPMHAGGMIDINGNNYGDTSMSHSAPFRDH